MLLWFKLQLVVVSHSIVMIENNSATHKKKLIEISVLQAVFSNTFSKIVSLSKQSGYYSHKFPAWSEYVKNYSRKLLNDVNSNQLSHESMSLFQ